MEKKVWNKPEIKDSKVINTHETECTCGVVVTGDSVTFKAGKHPCHKTGNGTLTRAIMAVAYYNYFIP